MSEAATAGVRDEPTGSPGPAVPPPGRPGRGRVRRLLRALSTVMIVAGSLLVADAVLAVTWQEPLSYLYTQRQQDELASDLATLERAAPPPLERKALRSLESPDRRLAFSARALARRADAESPVGRLIIPRAGVDDVVVEGTDAASLRRGPGHYPRTPLPGARGTVAIAGHRTTYGAPFRHLDRLRRGDRITIEMPYGRFTYAVERTRIVPPTALWVTQRVSYDRLVLTACHPLYSAAKRIVAFARLVRTQPRGSAS
jgi:sortase A